MTNEPSLFFVGQAWCPSVNREMITSWVIKIDKNLLQGCLPFAKSRDIFYQFRDNGSYFFSLSWKEFWYITNYVTFGSDAPTVFPTEILKIIFLCIHVNLKDWSSTKYPAKEHSRISPYFNLELIMKH